MKKTILQLSTFLLLSFFFVFFALAHKVEAATHYVRTNGHDSNCDGSVNVPYSVETSPSCAYATIAKGVSVASAGDTVEIAEGDYSAADPCFTSTTSGSEGSPITIHGNGSVLTGSIRLRSNWMVVDNLTIVKGKGYYAPNLLIGNTTGSVKNNNNIIRNSHFRGNHASILGINYGITIVGDNNLIENNDFDGHTYDLGRHDGSNGSMVLVDSTKNWEPGQFVGQKISNTATKAMGTITANDNTSISASLSGGSRQDWNKDDTYLIGNSFFIGISINTGSSNTIRNNKFHDMGDCERILDIQGDNHIIDGNEAFNNHVSGIASIHADFIQTAAGTVSDGVQVINNYIHDSPSMQIGNILGVGDGGTQVTNWLFANNVFANTSSLFSHSKITVVNNNFYRVNPGNHALVFYQSAYGDSSGSIIKNNAFIGCGGDSDHHGWYGTSNSAPILHTTNNFVSKTNATNYAAKSGFSEEGGINGGDPGLAALYSDCVSNNCNFYPLSISPLINKGLDLSSLISSATDKDGASRPQGSPWDIGAYEYQGATTANYRFDTNNSGEIDTTDALLTLRRSLDLDMTSTSWQANLTTGDANCDATVNSTDALLILRRSLGLDMSGTEWCG